MIRSSNSFQSSIDLPLFLPGQTGQPIRKFRSHPDRNHSVQYISHRRNIQVFFYISRSNPNAEWQLHPGKLEVDADTNTAWPILQGNWFFVKKSRLATALGSDPIGNSGRFSQTTSSLWQRDPLAQAGFDSLDKCRALSAPKLQDIPCERNGCRGSGLSQPARVLLGTPSSCRREARPLHLQHLESLPSDRVH